MDVRRPSTIVLRPIYLVIGLFVFALHSSGAHAQAVGDPVKGKQLFAKCAICHSVDAKAVKLGPTLANVVNRRAASVAGFKYSAAMKAKRFNWTVDNLDKFMASPRTFIVGTTMMSPNVTLAADRANIIAYLTSVSKKK